MSPSEKHWHICDDCLDPLAHDLWSLAQNCRRYFDVAKADRLHAEYRQIDEASGYSDDRLTEAQRTRRDELRAGLRALAEPPTAFDVETLYKRYHIDRAIDWLKFNVSVEYAEDFQRTLLGAMKQFSALEFKACQIINGDEGKDSTVVVRYAIQRLLNRHYELLREMFPDHSPEHEELPEDMRSVDAEILDEYVAVEQQFRDVSGYLRRVSGLVRAKMRRPDAGEIQRQIAEGLNLAAARLAGRNIADTIIEAGNVAQPDDEAEATKPTGPTSKSEQRAQWLAQAMLLVRDHPDWSDADIARRVGKDKSTLSRSKEYQVAAAMARGVKNDRHLGHISVDPDSGLRDVEAYSDDPTERDWDD